VDTLCAHLNGLLLLLLLLHIEWPFKFSLWLFGPVIFLEIKA
jgi:hypothetical protein